MNIAYAAGLIDGEGSITLPKNGHGGETRRANVAVAMTDPEPVQALIEFGGFLRTFQPKENRKLRHIWQINGNKAIDFLEELEPFLVIKRRKEIARLIINEYPRTKSGGSKDWSRAQKTNQIFRQMKTINAKRETKIYVPRTNHNEEEQLSYLAGILDGEGWISSEPRNGALCEVWSTDPELIGWLQFHFNGAAITNKSSKRTNRRQIYSWRIANKDTLAVANKLPKKLLIPRKKTALEAQKILIEQRMATKTKKVECSGGTKPS